MCNVDRDEIVQVEIHYDVVGLEGPGCLPEQGEFTVGAVRPDAHVNDVETAGTASAVEILLEECRQEFIIAEALAETGATSRREMGRVIGTIKKRPDASLIDFGTVSKALQAQREAGTRQKLVGLLLEDKGVLRNHQRVVVQGAGDGEVTSGSFSPTLGRSIGLARVPVAAGDTCQVEIRGKLLDAKIVKPPFVRNGKAQIELD